MPYFVFLIALFIYLKQEQIFLNLCLLYIQYNFNVLGAQQKNTQMKLIPHLVLVTELKPRENLFAQINDIYCCVLLERPPSFAKDRVAAW